MIRTLITLLIVFMFPLLASAQQIYGPLQAQNNFSEITHNGTQSTAQINLLGYTITLGGNFATSGANSLTFTTTGPTNVTLPTSGTLIQSISPTITTPTIIGLLTGNNYKFEQPVTSVPPNILGGQQPVSYQYLTSDDVNAGTGFILGAESLYEFGGSSMEGGRIAQYDSLEQTATSSSSNTNHNYIGTNSQVITGVGDGGTNLTTGALGAYFGYAANAILNTGATNVYEVTGGEIDTDIYTGASTKYDFGWSLVNNNAVEGSSLDAGLEFGADNQEGATPTGWNVGIVFDDVHGYSPVNGETTLLEGSFPTLGTQTILNGIYLNGFSCTNTCFSSNGFSVTTNGSINTAGINGVTNGSNALAGTVGEYMTATGTAVSLTNATATNITSITLTPGDWDVRGVITFNPAGSTVLTVQAVGLNSTSSTLGGTGTYTNLPGITESAGNGASLPAPTQRFNVTSSTTIYLIGFGTFSGSTCTATGTISARRIR
jgi:hypothetical protein